MDVLPIVHVDYPATLAAVPGLAGVIEGVLRRELPAASLSPYAPRFLIHRPNAEEPVYLRKLLSAFVAALTTAGCSASDGTTFKADQSTGGGCASLFMALLSEFQPEGTYFRSSHQSSRLTDGF